MDTKPDGSRERPYPTQTQPWSAIPRDYRLAEDGKRFCLALTERGTALVPWYGPQS
jgi:hypothetical protein